MEDYKGLIYIVGLLAWLGYNFFVKKRKNEAQRTKGQQTSKAPSQENKDFSTILDEILNEAKSKEAQKSPAPKPKPVEAKTSKETKYDIPTPPTPGKKGYEFGHYDTLEDIVDEEAAYEGFGTEEYKHETLETANTEQKFEFKDEDHLKASKDEHYASETDYDEAFDFDMEKAIIYSEVLARPKF